MSFHNQGNGTSSILQIETRSRVQTPTGSVGGVRNRLKDVSNALTTSKELLKILNRVWASADQPSSSMPLVSALHAELERARLQVNQLIQEQRSDQNEISYLMKCFAEEKAAWKNKEREAVEAAIDTIAGELEVERKLRRRFESLNKKLGKELAETKTAFMKTVKELESEKRARDIVEQVCDELARDVGEDKAVVEGLKRDAEKVREEVEKEREMLHLADMLREERVQMKLSEAKHQFEEKNTAVDKLRKQLEAFLGRKRGKEKRSDSHNLVTDEEISPCLSKSQFSNHQSHEKEDHGEVVEDLEEEEEEEDSTDSELHSIELNLNNNNGKNYKWAHPSNLGRESRRISVDDEIKGRMMMPRKSSSLQRSISEGVEWGIQARNLLNAADHLDCERISEMEKKQSQRKSCADEAHRNKAMKGLRDHLMSSSRTGSVRDFMSPTRQWEQQPWPSRDPCSVVQDRSSVAHGSASKSRLGGEGHTQRRSKW